MVYCKSARRLWLSIENSALLLWRTFQKQEGDTRCSCQINANILIYLEALPSVVIFRISPWRHRCMTRETMGFVSCVRHKTSLIACNFHSLSKSTGRDLISAGKSGADELN